MRDYFMKYGIAIGRRYTYKQKQHFLNEIAVDFQNLGYPVKATHGGGRAKKITNLYIGDTDKASVIFVAAYDTASRILLPGYKYYPFHTKKNINSETVNLLVNLLVSFAILLGVYFLASNLKLVPLWLKIISVIVIAVCLLFVYFFSKGLPNPVNYNRNSAAVVLIRSMADELKGRSDVAFVLADDCVASFGGLKQIKNDFGSQIEGKTIFLLDCLSYGDILVLAHKEHLNGEAEKITGIDLDLQIYDKAYTEEKASQMALGIFPNTFYLASGSISKKEFIVSGTRRKTDYKVNIDRLEKIKAMFLNYVQSH